MAIERTRPEEVSMSSEPEKIPAGDNGNGAPEQVNPLAEERDSYVRRWSQISSELPEDFSRHHINFARDYFRAQLRIARGQKKKARRILNGLVDRTGYKEFEKENRPILAAIDYAVRGTSHWEDDLRKKVEPAFRIKKS